MSDRDQILHDKSFWLFYNTANESHLDSALRELTEFEFRLNCPAPYVLEIDVRFDFWTINLGLRLGEKKHELGWWDEARWHPFALRWAELELFQRYWQQHGCTHGVPESLLLLAPFVGNVAPEHSDFSRRKVTIAKAYEDLGILLTAKEVADLTRHAFVQPSEDDYHWKEDAELGWVIGGDYPCYSIRNREHETRGEGRFPFQEFRALIAMLE
ncbi:MAG: hypothetical protein AB7K24_01000 [Gemmataceae bacterium]